MVARYIAGALGLVVLQAVVLYALGQPLVAESGQILLWANEPLSPDTSQHLADWYSLSHIIHGILFFGLLRLLVPQLSFGTRLLLAIGMEAAWEVLENTPWLIEHYRQQALAQGYVGDSILNSVSDTVAMVLGFVLAYKVRWWWWSVAAAVLLEAVALYFIRDSLLLNIIGLIYPLEFINVWQAGSL